MWQCGGQLGSVLKVAVYLVWHHLYPTQGPVAIPSRKFWHRFTAPRPSHCIALHFVCTIACNVNFLAVRTHTC
jgi:hypothetical protein